LGVCLGGWSPAGMHVLADALWQQRCLEVASRLHHVGVVDETRRTYRHHGWQRDAPRRIATFPHATQRVAPHRYATLEPLGKPGGSRAFSADGPPQAPVAPRRSCEAKYMRADEFAASRRAVLERRYRLRARARSGRPPSLNSDQLICWLQRWSVAPGSVRLSQKSDKVAVLLGIILLSALSLPDRREGGTGGSRCRRPLELSSGGSKFP